METNYNDIAVEYRRAKSQPWRSAVESFTMRELCGDLAGQSVLDIACGDGFYSRLVRGWGATRVLGIDLSEAMIGLVLAEEQRRPVGIEYRVGDGRRIDLPETFDLAVAAYLLNYARSREELASMCLGIANAIRPGGRLVAVNSKPGMDFATLPSFRRYGFEVTQDGSGGEGSPYFWTFYLDEGPLRVENYLLDLEVHSTALREAGFRRVIWHGPRLSPRVRSETGRKFWDPLLRHAPVIFLECLK